MFRRLRPAALPVLLFLASCSKDSEKTQGTPTPAPVATHDEPVTAKPASAKKEAKPAPPADKSAAKSYAAALGEARAATKAKKYDAAIAAFDKALAKVPGDARALAERGYAHFLAKHTDLAKKDLNQAIASTNDASVLGPAFYNLGLVSEAAGNADEARVAFARSNAIKPTQAAKAKLEGKTTCVAAIDRPKRKAKIVANISEAYDAMNATWTSKGYDSQFSAGAKPTGDAAIKKALCTAKCDGPGAWLARFPDSVPTLGFAVVPTADKKLAVYELGLVELDGCGTEIEQSVVKSGAVVQVHEEVTILGRDWVDEKGNSCSPSFEEDSTCLNPCGPVGWEAREYILDTTLQTVAVTVSEGGEFEKNSAEDPKIKPTVSVKESDGKVSVRGGGCSSDLDVSPTP